MKRTVRIRLVVFLVTAAALVGCASTGTVEGTIERNGSSANYQEIQLVHMLQGGDEESVTVTTDNAGHFRFDAIEPGTYYLMTTFVTEDRPNLALPGFPSPLSGTGIQGLPGQHGCVSEGGTMGVLTVAGTDAAGKATFISVISNSDEPLEIKAGSRVEKDILVFCR